MSISYESNKRDVNRKLDNSSKNEFREQLMPKQINLSEPLDRIHMIIMTFFPYRKKS